jgi:hypothetical protein
MKISNRYPQFKDSNALIIVAGERIAKFYLAGQAVINEIELLEPHSADYPYRQGINLRAGHGENFLWETYNISDQWQKKEFQIFLKERLRYFLKNTAVDKVYIFAPDQDIKAVEGLMPKKYLPKISGRFKKNIVKAHPFELLGEIRLLETGHLGESVPVSEEARKILERGE